MPTIHTPSRRTRLTSKSDGLVWVFNIAAGIIRNHRHYGRDWAPREMSMRCSDKADREFRDFVQSISVTAKELEAIILMPEVPIQEVKSLVRQGKCLAAPTSHFPVTCAASRFRKAPPYRAVAGGE